MGDFKIAKKYPIYFEIGAMFTYHTGRSKGDSIYTYHNEPGSSGEGEYTKRHYRIQAFSVTVPVSVSYQFRNAFNVEDLTLAPYAGLYFRFNAVRFNRSSMTQLPEQPWPAYSSFPAFLRSFSTSSTTSNTSASQCGLRSPPSSLFLRRRSAHSSIPSCRSRSS